MTAAISDARVVATRWGPEAGRFEAGAGSAQCRLHIGDAGGFIQPGHGPLNEEQRLGKLGFRRAEVRVC